jgi:hypothetical protein
MSETRKAKADYTLIAFNEDHIDDDIHVIQNLVLNILV